MEAIRSLIHGQQEEMAAALQDALIHCIAVEKEEASPIVIENKIKELETEFDRLLVLAVDENDIIDHKLKQISETDVYKRQVLSFSFAAAARGRAASPGLRRNLPGCCPCLLYTSDVYKRQALTVARNHDPVFDQRMPAKFSHDNYLQ